MEEIICDQELQITDLCSNLRRKLVTVGINLQVVDCSMAEMFHFVSLCRGWTLQQARLRGTTANR